MRKLALLVPFTGLLAATASSQTAALILLPDEAPQFVFSGPHRIVRASFCNPGTANLELALCARLYQADSATVMPLGPMVECKKLKLLAGQSVLENTAFNFPDVRVPALVEIRWLDAAGRELGRTRFWVCPPDMLKALDRPGTDNEIGILDPQNRLKPVLKSLGVRFQDLDAGAGLDGFAGKLAIVGSFLYVKDMPRGLGCALGRAVKRPLTILWLRPIPGQGVPNAYWTSKAAGVIAVADAQLVTDLADSPQAQFNLLRCVAWAEHPGQPSLEELACDGKIP